MSANGAGQELELRELTVTDGSTDFAALVDLDAAAFGYDLNEEFARELVLPVVSTFRMIGVFDGAELVATAAIRPNDLTYPGLGPAPVAAVTWVAVHPGYRRRGLLRRMMTHQLTGLHQDGEAVAILTASESGIYGRFGYGLAIRRMGIEVPRAAKLRLPATGGTVREVSRAIGLERVKQLYPAIARRTIGHLDRQAETWDYLMSDHPDNRGGLTTLRFAVHQDGYALFRWKENWTDRGPRHTVRVSQLVAGTARARIDLWDYLLGLDLAGEVAYGMSWPDEPLQDLLVDPRAMKATLGDHVWLRIVDLDRAVALRGYNAPTTVRVGIEDPACPWNSGVWELTLDTSGGTATRVSEEPEIRMGIADLGACFLGGTSLGRLAEAGLVQGEAVAIARLGLALSTPVQPWCPEGF